MPEDGDGGVPPVPPAPPAPTWGSAPPVPPTATWGSAPRTEPYGWAGLPAGAVYGPRPERRFRMRAVVFALVGGIVLGLAMGLAGLLTLVFVFPDALAPGTVAGTHPVIPAGAGPVVGDCLMSSPGDADLTSQADVVDCRGLHGSEVIGLAQLPEVSGPLDDTDVDYFADGACRLAYGDYIGGNYDTSSLFPDALVPSHQAYDQGERAVYCLVNSADHNGGHGSVQGSG